MVRKIKSPTRTISNRGQSPRFMGYFPCYKSDAGVLPFDSIPALDCGLYLEWRSDVMRIEFEPEKFEATDGADRPAAIPDYRCTLDTGEIEVTEAKSSERALRESERQQLHNSAEHCAYRGYQFRVVYRDELHKNGFLDTILLLRPFGWMTIPAATTEIALARLLVHEATTIEDWRRHAVAHRVPISVLYHLLYRQRLPLVYRRLLFTELLRWRV